ncbi:glycoside hydrolase superfamily [Leptodontidium sp. 2 PMI_412]|nr:glycoside hydrolase superfamily [Leptodontidium sp. 2 PMI_412]
MGLLTALFASLVAAAAFIPTVRAGFDPLSLNNVAVYWGQNSYGAASGPLTQQRLTHYCKSEKVDIIPLAFLTNMANPESLNFANRSPAELENDIKECQEVHKKTIVLSLGGEVTHGNGFASPDDAVQKAQQLWVAFGPPGSSSVNRKFGKAVVDGFDFDNEKPLSNMVPFARELQRLMAKSSKKDGKKYLLTAAPQCPFPDSNVGPLLSSDVAFDAVFVQFYNNPGCSVGAFVSGSDKQPGFNFETWQNWAKQSKNPDVKVMVGVPSTPAAAGSGFISGDKLAEIVAYCKRFSNFGGVMFWDMTQAWSAPDVLNKARVALGESSRSVAPVSTRPPPPEVVSTPVEVVKEAEPTKSQALPAPTAGEVIVLEVWNTPPPGHVNQWNQCDGRDWNEGHTCQDPYICKYFSDWYS